MCEELIVYNDEQLATLPQMEKMAKAYKEHLNKENNELLNNFDLLSHLFNEAGCLAGKLQSKASGKKLKETLDKVYLNLLDSAKTFYSALNKHPLEEDIATNKNFIKSAKRLILCQLEIITLLQSNLTNIKLKSIIDKLLENIKLLIEIA